MSRKGIRDEVAIVGVGCCQFGENWDQSPSDMIVDAAYEAYADAGSPSHLAFPVRVHQNGAFFAVYDFVEDGDDRWLERVGLDPEGALYKMYDKLETVADGEKKTRKSS